MDGKKSKSSQLEYYERNKDRLNQRKREARAQARVQLSIKKRNPQIFRISTTILSKK